MVRNGSVVLCRRYQEMSFGPWLGSFLFGTVENCLWPTLETVHAGSDQGRIHARALPLLWRHQSKRWGFMCLARRGLQLLCRGCRPVAA